MSRIGDRMLSEFRKGVLGDVRFGWQEWVASCDGLKQLGRLNEELKGFVEASCGRINGPLFGGVGLPVPATPSEEAMMELWGWRRGAAVNRMSVAVGNACRREFGFGEFG
jgi:hypothetical protein